MYYLVEKIVRKVEFELAAISSDTEAVAVLRQVIDQLEGVVDEWENDNG